MKKTIIMIAAAFVMIFEFSSCVVHEHDGHPHHHHHHHHDEVIIRS